MGEPWACSRMTDDELILADNETSGIQDAHALVMHVMVEQVEQTVAQEG